MNVSLYLATTYDFRACPEPSPLSGIRSRIYCGRGGFLFLPPTFQGMICQSSLLRAASPNLKHLPVGKDSRTVAPSCGPAHFQSPSHSRGATSTMYIVLYLLVKFFCVECLLYSIRYMFWFVNINYLINYTLYWI